MTKRAVLQTYREFLDRLTDEMLDVVEEELGGGLVGRVARRGTREIVERLEDEMLIQGEVVVKYATALARDREAADVERRFLETNPVYQRYDGDETETLERDLLAHLHEVGRDLAPLVDSDRDDFWAALRAEYDRAEAERIIDRQFSQAETFKSYRDGLFTSQRVGDSVIAVVEAGESRLREQLREELDRVYDEA